MDRNTLTIVAILALSVSNLFVGITTQNALLIIASSVISAALAGLYFVRSELPSTAQDAAARKSQTGRAKTLPRARPFPLWTFGLVLFLVLPALLVFLQTYSG
ncbi:MAG: hypothetical protein AAFY82_01305 [Pseudomonadota bacterium]